MGLAKLRDKSVRHPNISVASSVRSMYIVHHLNELSCASCFIFFCAFHCVTALMQMKRHRLIVHCLLDTVGFNECTTKGTTILSTNLD